MTTLRVRGVNKVTAKGRTYFYHRATGTRLKSSPDDPVAFASEVAALDVATPAHEKLKIATLDKLIAVYKASPEWLQLKRDSQIAYDRALNALKPLGGMALVDINQPQRILAIRDKMFKRHGRWLANGVRSMLSVLLGWGTPRGYVTMNAAKGVPNIRRSKSAGVANKAWTHAEVQAVLREAPTPGVRKGIALAYYTGLRLKDVVELPASARASGEIMLQSSKPGVPLSVFETKALAAILDTADPVPGSTVVCTLAGKPYTRSGFSAIFKRLVKRLADAGVIRPGLTFHGLRKSLGKDAAELGFSENDIARALGQRSPASARPYTVEAQQRAASRRVIKALEKKGKR